MDAIIAALADQGMQRRRSEDIASGAGRTPATNVASPDLLKDPLLNTDPDQVRQAPADAITAMPWFSRDEEPRAILTPDPSPTETPVPDPVPSPEPQVSPEANSDVKAEPANQEPSARKLLENSWLRVQLQPDIKSPTDSVEPMGLFNRIKGIFARSAGG